MNLREKGRGRRPGLFLCLFITRALVKDKFTDNRKVTEMFSLKLCFFEVIILEVHGATQRIPKRFALQSLTMKT